MPNAAEDPVAERVARRMLLPQERRGIDGGPPGYGLR